MERKEANTAAMFMKHTRSLLALCLVSVIVVGQEIDPKIIREAEGVPEVKYVYCVIKEGSCEVSARFKTMDACERHQIIQNSYCDWRNEKEEVHCRVEDSPLRGQEFESFCIP